MTIEKNQENSKLTLTVIGRLDTTTAPKLQEEKASFDGITELVLDFSQLDYISSAGLRVVLSFQNVMNKQGRMVVKNVNENVYEVLDITGFTDFLTIE